MVPLQARCGPEGGYRYNSTLHDHGTRRGWVVSSTPRPHFTPGKDPVHILQVGWWAPGPVWTGGKSRPHRIRSRTVQPVDSRYTDWATQPTTLDSTLTNQGRDNFVSLFFFFLLLPSPPPPPCPPPNARQECYKTFPMFVCSYISKLIKISPTMCYFSSIFWNFKWQYWKSIYLSCYLYVVPILTDIHYSICHVLSFQFAYVFPSNILARKILFPEYRIPRSNVVRNLPHPLSFLGNDLAWRDRKWKLPYPYTYVAVQ